MGRRTKYDSVLLMLRDGEPYTPGMITEVAKQNDMLPRGRKPDPNRPRHKRPSPTPEQTMCSTLWRFARNRGFPEEGDAKVFVRAHP